MMIYTNSDPEEGKNGIKSDLQSYTFRYVSGYSPQIMRAKKLKQKEQRHVIYHFNPCIT